MIHVIYGSQTGNSEEIAKRIHKEIKEQFPQEKCELWFMNKFLSTIQKFPENKTEKYILITICSTTGAGDPPDNCQNFFRWIRRKTHSNDTLSNVFYTVLGLGDSNYSKYQYIPRQIDDSFAKLGAKKFYSKGEADDAYGLEIVVEPWITGLYPVIEGLLNEFKINQKVEQISAVSDISIDSSISFEIEKNLKQENEIISPSDMNSTLSNLEINYFNAKIASKNLISGVKSQNKIYTIEISLDKNDRNLYLGEYLPGSSISIIPEENESKLNIISQVLIIDEKILIVDKSHNFNLYSDFYEKYPHFKKILQKGYLTSEEIFVFVLDFSSILKKFQTEDIKYLLTMKIENKEIVNKIGILFSKYTELILRNKVSLYDILYSLFLSNIKINVSLLEVLQYFPIKYPRSYSLLSYKGKESYNDKKEKNEHNLQIVFSLMNERIIRKFPNIKTSELLKGFNPGEFYYRGQTTQYLKGLEKENRILICNIGNFFQFPLNGFLYECQPIIYICNGTGIGPCISFLRQILNIMKTDKTISHYKIGQLLIFTGFRHASLDKNETIYEDFINESLEFINQTCAREIVSYHRCLSICSENEEEEVGIWRNCRINTHYVQDLIIEHEGKIYDNLFTKNGTLMICGDIQKLYDECMNNIMSILMHKQHFSREKCVKYFEEMKQNNRIIVEKWC